MSSEFGAGCEFIALDLETTGLWAAADRIVEIAAVRFRESGEVLETFQSLVNPERPVSPGAYAVHGITDQELAQAPRASDILPELVAFLGSAEALPSRRSQRLIRRWFSGQRAEARGPGRAVTCDVRHAGALREQAADARESPPWIRLRGISGWMRLGLTGRWRTRFWSRRSGFDWVDIGTGTTRSRFECSMPANGWRFRMDGKRSSKRWNGVSTFESSTRVAPAGHRPGQITPRRLESRGGSAFLVAYCHLDSLEKSFRVDRIRAIEFTSETGQEVVRVERRTAGG